jgi:hypothetical protein
MLFVSGSYQIYQMGLCRVDGVPGFLSSRPNWLPPPPHPQVSVAPPFGPRGRGTYSLGGEGVGGSQFVRRDRHSGTLGIV